MKVLNLIMALVLSSMALNVGAAGQLDNYKLVVIKNALASGSIIGGDYDKSITQLTQTIQQSPDEQYESSMSLCAAKIMIGALPAAITACDNAVSLIGQTRQYQTIKDKYKALALNNRAIVKHLNNDSNGAYQDFNQAISLVNEPLIVDNFQWFSSQLVKQQLATTQR